MEKRNLNEILNQLLINKISNYKHESLNKITCLKIYSDIFEIFTEIFTNSNIQIQNETMNYISQQFYDSVVINQVHKLDPNIFDQRAAVDNIPTKDLILLLTMFKDTGFIDPVITEIKRRS